MASGLRGAFLVLCLTATAANGTTVTWSGFLNDPANTVLVASDLSPAQFADDWAVSNNVALYALSVPFSGDVTFASSGHGAGGAEPYFSLFQGSGLGATFIDSNYFITDIDFNLTRFLASGDYIVALGVWMNMSLAENYLDPALTLGDGFTGLGVPGGLGNAFYELSVTTPDGPMPPVPEPSTLVLLGSGLAALASRRRRAS